MAALFLMFPSLSQSAVSSDPHLRPTLPPSPVTAAAAVSPAMIADEDDNLEEMEQRKRGKRGNQSGQIWPLTTRRRKEKSMKRRKRRINQQTVAINSSLRLCCFSLSRFCRSSLLLSSSSRRLHCIRVSPNLSSHNSVLYLNALDRESLRSPRFLGRIWLLWGL